MNNNFLKSIHSQWLRYLVLLGLIAFVLTC